MNSSTAIFDFEKILEKERADHNSKKEKEMLENIDFLENNKQEQSISDFLYDRFFDSVLASIIIIIGLSFGLILAFLSHLLLDFSVLASSCLLVPVSFLGVFFVDDLLERVKIKAKNKGRIEELKAELGRKNDFLNECFLSCVASPELIVAFKKEMGKQALVEAYLLNEGLELSNGDLLDYYKKHSGYDCHENTEFHLLYEDCIQKAELY